MLLSYDQHAFSVSEVLRRIVANRCIRIRTSYNLVHTNCRGNDIISGVSRVLYPNIQRIFSAIIRRYSFSIDANTRTGQSIIIIFNPISSADETYIISRVCCDPTC